MNSFGCCPSPELPTFFFEWVFMLRLDKSSRHSKLEVASLRRYINNKGDPKFWGSFSGTELFPLQMDFYSRTRQTQLNTRCEVNISAVAEIIKRNHDIAVATQCYRRLDFPMAILAYFFFSSQYSVKTTSLKHMPNDLFDQISRKGVPFGSLVQKFSTPNYNFPKLKNFHCKMWFFVIITHLV